MESGSQRSRQASSYSESSSTTDLYQSLVRECYIDSTHFQERRSTSSLRRIFFILSDLLSVTHHLGGCGYQRYELRELRTKVLDAGIINREEKIGLCLLGKTRPVNDEPAWIDNRIP